MVESWAPQVVELLLGSVEEADSFVYLNAIKALSALAERFHHIVCPALVNAFARPLLHPRKKKPGPLLCVTLIAQSGWDRRCSR